MSRKDQGKMKMESRSRKEIEEQDQEDVKKGGYGDYHITTGRRKRRPDRKDEDEDIPEDLDDVMEGSRRSSRGTFTGLKMRFKGVPVDLRADLKCCDFANVKRVSRWDCVEGTGNRKSCRDVFFLQNSLVLFS